MKKIKGLLLFGILTLLGIGSSFSYEYIFNPVEYYTVENQYSNYIFGGASSFSFINANYGQFSPISQILRYNSSTLDDSILNFSNYSLTGSYSLNRISSYLFVNNSSVSLLYKSSSSNYGSYLFRLSSGVDSISSLFSQGLSNFIRIDCGLDGISVDNIFNSSAPCQSSRTFVFTSGYVYDSRRGIVNDLTYDSVDYTRGSMSPGVGNEYSFAFSPSISTDGNVATIDSSSIPYYFATVSPSIDGTWNVYKGLYILKLDTLYKKSNTGDFRILAIALTGSTINENTLDFIYSRYSCPSNSFTFSQCSFIDGGYLRPSNLTNSFTSYNGVLYSLTGNRSTSSTSQYLLFQNLLYFLTTSSSNIQGNLSPVIYSIESSNIIELYRPFFSSAGSFNNTNFSLGLSSSEGINIFDYIDLGGGGGSQSTYSGSVSFDSCIETQVCWDSTGSNGEIHRICTTECVSPEVIESGSYVGSNGTIYYVDSPFDISKIAISDGILFDTGFIDDDGLISADYYSGLFNGEGFQLGVCPYPSSDLFSFASKIKILNFYPFMPLNCVGSAFIQGLKVHYFDDFGLFPDLSSQLINGDSNYHKTFYRFLDLCLSVGLLFMGLALLRIIKK